MLGVIGGTGLYALPELRGIQEIDFDTPWGRPSSPLIKGDMPNGRAVVFLARHGRGHRLNPTNVPYRANIAALKAAGVTHLLSVNAVGSLQEELPPRMAVVPDQIIDQTRSRGDRTFFDNGVVVHVGLADPFCDRLRTNILRAVRSATDSVRDGGTYICIEGPQFSTRAESAMYRAIGGDIIGMTAMPEARLAREAGLHYAALAMVTDYDVWHEHEDDVTIATVQRVLSQNISVAQDVVRALARVDLEDCATGCAIGSRESLTTHDPDPALMAAFDLIWAPAGDGSAS